LFHRTKLTKTKRSTNIIIEDSDKSPRCGADDTHNSMNSKAYEPEGLFTPLMGMPTIIHIKCGSNKSWMKTMMMGANVHLLTLRELLDNLNKASQEDDAST
jgi:hypothetical protein